MNTISSSLKKVALSAISMHQRERASIDYRWFERNYERSLTVLEKCEANALFLVPHADDDLLGGYALAESMSGNIVFGYYGMTGTNTDQRNKEQRDAEFQKYVEALGAPFVRINSAEDIIVAIREYQVKEVFLPSLIDWHSEHRKVNYDLYDALIQANKSKELRVVWYSITVPISSQNAKIIPMTEEEQERKYLLFKNVYKSQIHMPVERFMLQERINALNTDYYAAEVFEILNRSVWERTVVLFRACEPNRKMVKDLNKLSNQINNLRRIRSLSQKFFRQYME